MSAVSAQYKSKLLHGSIQVRYCYNLSSDIIVESVHAVGVDETVADPQARFDALCNLHGSGIYLLFNKNISRSNILQLHEFQPYLSNDIKGILNAIL